MGNHGLPLMKQKEKFTDLGLGGNHVVPPFHFESF
jgi:hypothetical protein